MNDTQTQTAVLVDFGGFYESIHADHLDQASVDSFQDDQGDCQAPEAFHEAFGYTGPMLKAYCKEYTETFQKFLKDEHEMDLPSMKMEELDSPRFYNFATDRIFVTLSEADVQALYQNMLNHKDVMQQVLQDHFTPCSGFIPHYSNDLDVWLAKDLADWDHNEIGMLIKVATDGGWNDMDMLGSFDTFREEVVQLVSEHMPEKASTVLEQWHAGEVA